MSYQVELKKGKKIYVYEATSYWDKEKQQSRQKRKYVGRKDPISGEIILKKTPRKPKRALNFGNTQLVEAIIKKTGLYEIIREIYPELYKEIIALVQFIISEESSLYLASSWADYNYIDLKDSKMISSQRISEILNYIGEDVGSVMEFFKAWINKQQSIKNGVYFDITSLSTYSKLLELAEWGYNRDKENLAQINLGLVSGEESELPLFYRIYQGSIPDVKTITNISKFNDIFNLENVTFVVDRGFYSKKNLESLKEKIVIPLPFTTKLSKELLEETASDLTNPENLFRYKDKLYNYVKKEVNIGAKKFIAHIYKNKERYNMEEMLFYKGILEIEERVLNCKDKFDTEEEALEFIESILKGFSKFFTAVRVSKKYIIKRNQIELNKRSKKFGVFIVVTNVKENSNIKILELIKGRNKIEEIFDIMKNDLSQNRLNVSSANRTEGKIFLIFLSLIISVYMEKCIKNNKKLNDYSKKEIISELKKLRLIELDDGKFILSEPSKKIREISEVFEINLEDSFA